MDARLVAHFPRTAHYDAKWVRDHSLGENVLYNTESLCEVLPLARNMRVLDLGCGHAISSIFLAKEFGVHVVAVDSTISERENLGRVCDMGCLGRVIPVRERAERLDFPNSFFDAIIAIDVIHFVGATRRFLPRVLRWLKPGGRIGIVDAFVKQKLRRHEEAPPHLRPLFSRIWSWLHPIRTWEQLWSRSSQLRIECAEEIPQSDLIRSAYIEEKRCVIGEAPIVKAIEQDRGQFISLMRMVAQKISNAAPD